MPARGIATISPSTRLPAMATRLTWVMVGPCIREAELPDVRSQAELGNELLHSTRHREDLDRRLVALVVAVLVQRAAVAVAAGGGGDDGDSLAVRMPGEAVG